MAAAGGLTIHVRGLDEAVAKLGPDLIAQPARNFLNRVGADVQGEARKLAPVDRGNLKGSIVAQVDTAHLPLWVRIGPGGTAEKYARFVEEGTRPHFVPAKYIGKWAGRHGMDPRKGVFVTGKAQPYLRPGLDAARPQIPIRVEQMAREIETAAAV